MQNWGGHQRPDYALPLAGNNATESFINNHRRALGFNLRASHSPLPGHLLWSHRHFLDYLPVSPLSSDLSPGKVLYAHNPEQYGCGPLLEAANAYDTPSSLPSRGQKDLFSKWAAESKCNTLLPGFTAVSLHRRSQLRIWTAGEMIKCGEVK